MIHLQIYKHYNKIKTKLHWKAFTKVIKMPREGSFDLDRQCLNQKRSKSAFNLTKDRVSKE
jgi:hypothetical protein